MACLMQHLVTARTFPALGRQIPSARKIWLNIHLWLGLTAGFVLALIGLTGSLLVIGGRR